MPKMLSLVTITFGTYTSNLKFLFSSCMLICLSSGVPKLKRLELEAACEEFNNIVLSYPAFTVYKGILSSGVEIAVVATTITSPKEWSKESEKLFRKKVYSSWYLFSKFPSMF